VNEPADSLPGTVSNISHSTERNTAESPLLRLSGEIRNKIWGYVASDFVVRLAGNPVTHPGVIFAGPACYNDSVTLPGFQLPRVCRRICDDTRIAIYRHCLFTYTEYDAEVMKGFISGGFPISIWRGARQLSKAQLGAITTLAPRLLPEIQPQSPKPQEIILRLKRNFPKVKRVVFVAAHRRLLTVGYAGDWGHLTYRIPVGILQPALHDDDLKDVFPVELKLIKWLIKLTTLPKEK
jgi:hypothetical protein